MDQSPLTFNGRRDIALDRGAPGLGIYLEPSVSRPQEGSIPNACRCTARSHLDDQELAPGRREQARLFEPVVSDRAAVPVYPQGREFTAPTELQEDGHGGVPSGSGVIDAALAGIAIVAVPQDVPVQPEIQTVGTGFADAPESFDRAQLISQRAKLAQIRTVNTVPTSSRAHESGSCS